MSPQRSFAPVMRLLLGALVTILLALATTDCGGGSSSNSGNGSSPAPGNSATGGNSAAPPASSGSGVSGGSAGAGSGSSASNPGSPGTPAGPEHLIYAQTGNGVMIYDAHPAEGKIEPLAGPVGTNLSLGNGVHYDAAQHVVFATGMGPNPDRGSTTQYVAVISADDPKHPALLGTQQMNASIQNLLIDQSGLLPVEVDFANALQSWRYDPAAHTFQTLGGPQFFDQGDVPTTWLHPNQKIVIAVTASGPANGPFTTHIVTFQRDPVSGALTKNATLNLSGAAGGSALSPDGRFLLVPDTQSGVLYIITIDSGSGSLTLAGKSSNSAVFYLYRFVDATHVLGRAKTDDSNKLTLYSFDASSSSVTADSSVQLAGALPQFVSAGNTIYAAETGWLEMIAFDPASNSLRVTTSINAGADAVDVNAAP